jgi:putative effector of murein hydrolase
MLHIFLSFIIINIAEKLTHQVGAAAAACVENMCGAASGLKMMLRIASRFLKPEK